MIAGATTRDDAQPLARPSAIRHAGAAARGSASRATRSMRSAASPAWPRAACLGGAAAGRRHRALAAAARAAGFRQRTPTPRSTGIAVIEAANAEEEALAIAVALREAVERPDKTAALVTPDRALARRVLAALRALEHRGRRFRRRRARRHAGRRVRAARGGGRARRARAGDAAGAAQASAAAARRARGATRARSRRWNARCCAGRGRARHAGLAHALADLPRRAREASAASEPSRLHRSDPRIALTDRELEAAADSLAKLTAALAPLETPATAQRSPTGGIASR